VAGATDDLEVHESGITVALHQNVRPVTRLRAIEDAIREEVNALVEFFDVQVQEQNARDLWLALAEFDPQESDLHLAVFQMLVETEEARKASWERARSLGKNAEPHVRKLRVLAQLWTEETGRIDWAAGTKKPA